MSRRSLVSAHANEKDLLIAEGSAVAELGNGFYRVLLKLAGVTREITAALSGRMRAKHVRVVAGDAVTVEISPYDLTKGRIVRRLDTR